MENEHLILSGVNNEESVHVATVCLKENGARNRIERESICNNYLWCK